MTTAARKTVKKTDPFRRSLLAKTAVAQKQLGLDDDDFRDLLERITGKRSRTRMSNAQLVDVVEELKTKGFAPKQKPKLKDATQRKIRALWISLWHLGVTHSPDDKALNAFCKRVSGGRAAGIERLQWIRADDAFKVIEALKKMAERQAGVDWSAHKISSGAGAYSSQFRDRARVLEAQWRILGGLGELKNNSPHALGYWLEKFVGRPVTALSIPDADADRAIVKLGDWIRSAKKEPA